MNSAEDRRPIRLLTLVQKATGIVPHQRFRHEQWAPHLEREHNIELTFEPFESPALTEVLYEKGRTIRKTRLVLRDAHRRWLARRRAFEYDGVVIMRQAMLIGGAWVEGFLARHGVPILYDFDDAIWHWSPSARNGLASLAHSFSLPYVLSAIT